MTVYVVSAGRSGSAWLSTVLFFCGHNVKHEQSAIGSTWVHERVNDLDVISDTTLIYDQTFIRDLRPEDKVVVLRRKKQDIQKSIDKLLPGCDAMNACLSLSNLYNQLIIYNLSACIVLYEELFEQTGRDKLINYLGLDRQTAIDAWEYFKHMRIENRTCMNDVQRLWNEANQVS